MVTAIPISRSLAGQLNKLRRSHEAHDHHRAVAAPGITWQVQGCFDNQKGYDLPALPAAMTSAISIRETLQAILPASHHERDTHMHAAGGDYEEET
jgi:hypothetical protein